MPTGDDKGFEDRVVEAQAYLESRKTVLDDRFDEFSKLDAADEKSYLEFYLDERQLWLNFVDNCRNSYGIEETNEAIHLMGDEWSIFEDPFDPEDMPLGMDEDWVEEDLVLS